MRVYVVCDLEGTAGIVDFKNQCWSGGDYFGQARRLATLELNALVEGVMAGGADEVWAWDGHGNFPGGLDVEFLHPECKMVMSAGDGGPVGLDSSFDAVFMCGLHGMSGAERGVLAHSFVPHIRNFWLNGRLMGEIGLNALTAGLAGVPTVFLAGDRAAAAEIEDLVPGVVTAVVKEGLLPGPGAHVLSQAPALSLAPEMARDFIREAAQRAVSHVGRVAPFRIDPPYVNRVEFTEAKHADAAAKRPAVVRINETTVEKTAENLDALVL